MKRRTLLQSLAAALLVRPSGSLALRGQGLPALTEAQVTTLRALAEVVLPTEAGDAGRAAAVDSFVTWVRDYREGAERGHTYGASVVSPVTGPSPAVRYPAQFAALDQAASVRGAATFAALGLPERREIVETTLNQGPRITNLPQRPNGTSLIADFMGSYFNGETGYDLAYEAAIGRDTCRGLDNSDAAPARLRKA